MCRPTQPHTGTNLIPPTVALPTGPIRSYTPYPAFAAAEKKAAGAQARWPKYFQVKLPLWMQELQQPKPPPTPMLTFNEDATP
jgi:hypothetical protein